MQQLQEKLFRKVALERLSSPEQLDSLMRVITPKSWLALAPLVAILLLALLWGWFGSLPSKVSVGKCILINPVGLADVSSGSSGRITQLLVGIGDTVQPGAGIARVAQPDLADRIERTQARVKELESQLALARSFASQGSALTAQSLEQQRQVLQSQMAAAQERSRFAQERGRIARERVAVQEELARQGLVTNQAVLATRQEEAAARQEEISAQLEAASLQNQVKQLPLNKLERDKQGRSEVASIEAQLNDTRRELNSLNGSLAATQTITSPHAGRVIEIKAGNGMLVGQGAPIVTLELADRSLSSVEAVIYAPLGEGRKVRPKMEAQVVPSTVKREEHGFIRADVSYVSDYPATPQSMMRLLQNDTLVKDLAGSQPPTEIRATLRKADTPSGYAWSSARGPALQVVSGTACQAEITVERQRPLSLVIPALRKSLGLH